MIFDILTFRNLIFLHCIIIEFLKLFFKRNLAMCQYQWSLKWCQNLKTIKNLKFLLWPIPSIFQSSFWISLYFQPKTYWFHLECTMMNFCFGHKLTVKLSILLRRSLIQIIFETISQLILIHHDSSQDILSLIRFGLLFLICNQLLH